MNHLSRDIILYGESTASVERDPRGIIDRYGLIRKDPGNQPAAFDTCQIKPNSTQTSSTATRVGRDMHPSADDAKNA